MTIDCVAGDCDLLLHPSSFPLYVLYSLHISQVPKLSKHLLDNANQVVDTVSFDTMSVSSFGDEDSDDDTVPLHPTPGERETGWVISGGFPLFSVPCNTI